jgi:uncharacterized protein
VGIKVQSSFVVPAPADHAFGTLIDVPRIVPCMPGTELTETLSDNRFRAVAKLRVGPVELQFKGEGELYEVDRAQRTSKMRAKGADAKGRGSFQTEIAFTVEPQGESSRVTVDTDLTLSGTVAQYGRGAGIVREVTSQLTTQFAAELAALIMAERVVQAVSHATKRVTATETVAAVTASATPAPTPSASAAPIARSVSSNLARKPLPDRSVPSAKTPISGIRLLFAAIKATLGRWFGARP